MAEAKCQFTISRLEWLDDAVEVRCHAVRKAREEILDGTLRNNRGTVSSIFIGRFIASKLQRITRPRHAIRKIFDIRPLFGVE